MPGHRVSAKLHGWLASAEDMPHAQRQRYVLALQLSVEGCCMGDDMMVEGTLVELIREVETLRVRLHAVSTWNNKADTPVTDSDKITICVIAMGVLSLDGGPEEIGGRDARIYLLRDVAAGIAGDVHARLALL